MIKILPDLPGWTFEIEEVSAGVYKVVARDKHGQMLSNKGTDPDGLLKSCGEEARRLMDAAQDAK